MESTIELPNWQLHFGIAAVASMESSVGTVVETTEGLLPGAFVEGVPQSKVLPATCWLG